MIEAGWAAIRNKYYLIKRATIAASSSDDNAIVAAPGAGNKIILLAWFLSPSAAVNAKWRSATTDKTGLTYFASAGQTVQGSVTVECAENEALNLNLSGAVAVGGNIEYVIVPTGA